jgi:hypothetical protein
MAVSTPTPDDQAPPPGTLPDAGSVSGRSAGLWGGVVGAAAVWALQLNVTYALAPHLDRESRYFWVHVFSGVCMLLAVGLAVFSYREWRSAGGGSPDGTEGGRTARRRFLGALGFAFSLLSAMAIVAQGLSAFFLDGRWQ